MWCAFQYLGWSHQTCKVSEGLGGGGGEGEKRGRRGCSLKQPSPCYALDLMRDEGSIGLQPPSKHYPRAVVAGPQA